MARAMRVGDETAGAVVEYIKTRRQIRLSAWRDGREAAAVEVPTSRFLEELGLAPGELGFGEVYLLQAYLQDQPGGALRLLTLAFPGELEARQAFRRLRPDHQLPDEWAQVVALDARCRMERLCWFGTPGGLGGARTQAAQAAPSARQVDDGSRPVRARRWGARRR